MREAAQLRRPYCRRSNLEGKLRPHQYRRIQSLLLGGSAEASLSHRLQPENGAAMHALSALIAKMP
jgi:hypothetical protein